MHLKAKTSEPQSIYYQAKADNQGEWAYDVILATFVVLELLSLEKSWQL